MDLKYNVSVDSFEELHELRKEIFDDLSIIKSYNDSVLQSNNNLKLALVKEDFINNRSAFMQVLDENNTKLTMINNLVKNLLK